MDYDKKLIIDADIKERPKNIKDHFANMPPFEKKVRIGGAIGIVVIAIPIFVQITTGSKWFGYVYWFIVVLILAYIAIDQYKKRF